MNQSEDSLGLLPVMIGIAVGKLGYLADFSYLYSVKEKPTYEELLEENVRLSERVAYLERMLYGSRRDRRRQTLNEGPTLFDDEFKEALDEKHAAIEQTAREISAEAAKRREVSRKPASRPSGYQYAGLREEVRVVYPEGIDVEEYDVIGRDVTRVLHRTPAQVWVEVIERPILRRKDERNAVSPQIRQAPAPKAVIGGNHVGADFLAQIVIDKYVYHLPEYRQVRQYADMGVKLPASTVNDWLHAVASKLYPLYESLQEDIRRQSYLQIDEVPWRIADRPDKCRKGYAWQFLDAAPDTHGLYFYYLKGSRAGEIPRAQLKGYAGAVQTYGYGVYDYFEHIDNVTLLGCMAHVRRKFAEADKSHPLLASKALGYIALLYELEANLKARNATERETVLERKAKALPIMEAMEEWMKLVSVQCTPADLMGKAIDYAYKLWPRLKRYTENGMYRIDNNAVERMQRPSVMGRKNFLFSKNDRGAEDNAVFYSLLESCSVVGISPLEWLAHALDKLEDDMSEEDISRLLPYYYKKTRN